MFRARVIEYQRKGFQPERLVTSLLDADRYPAAELIELYHERWEIELGYGEIKTKMLRSVRLRSKRSRSYPRALKVKMSNYAKKRRPTVTKKARKPNKSK